MHNVTIPPRIPGKEVGRAHSQTQKEFSNQESLGKLGSPDLLATALPSPKTSARFPPLWASYARHDPLPLEHGQ